MYEIKKNVPIPSTSKGKVRYPKLHQLAQMMEIGDCVEVKDEYEAKALVKYISYLRNERAELGYKHGKGSYRVLENGAAVWRVQ